MRWIGFSNVQRMLASRSVTPQLMGRAVRLRAASRIAPRKQTASRVRLGVRAFAWLALCALMLISISQAAAGQQDLHRITRNSDRDSLRLLLEQGFDPNARDTAGMTPLHYAAMANFLDIAMMLIDHGADLHVQDNRGATPVNVARGRTRCVLEAMSGVRQRRVHTLPGIVENDTILVYNGQTLRAGVSTAKDVWDLLGPPHYLESSRSFNVGFFQYPLKQDSVLFVHFTGLTLPLSASEQTAKVSSFLTLHRCDEW